MAAGVDKGVLARSLGIIGGAVGRAVGAVKASYEAASHGRRMRGWTARSSGPNAAIAGVQTIRNRARDATRNDWSGESGVQKWTTSLIGTGIVPRFKRLTKARRTALMTLWAKWVKAADADGVLNFYGLQSLAVRAWLESGEVFIRRRMRSRGADGLPVPMQIQLIEADQVPMLDAETYAGLPTGNVIRSGIEFDRRGRRVAYWMFRQHPGERQTGNVDPSRLLRVPAAEVIHMFEPKRIGQLRGVSMQAVILAKLRNVGGIVRRTDVLTQVVKQTNYMWVTTTILTVFGAIIAFGVIYHQARIALSMRSRDLASLRVDTLNAPRRGCAH